MIRYKDISNEKFGKLKAIEKVEKPKGIKGTIAYWKCECDCGNIAIVRGDDLRRGTIKSCGCYSRSINIFSGVESVKNDLYENYRRIAKQRNLVFNIDKKLFFEITQKNCFYCGVEPSNTRKNKHGNVVYIYSGIDRVNNNKGYIPSNIVSCCWNCNWGKRNLTTNEFYNWIDRVYKYKHKLLE